MGFLFKQKTTQKMPHDYPQHFYKSPKEKSIHRQDKKWDKKYNVAMKMVIRGIDKDAAKGKHFLDKK